LPNLDLNSILNKIGEDVTLMFAIEAEFLIGMVYPDEAIYLCVDGLRSFPKYVSGYTVLAKSYIVLGRLEEAIKTMDEAVQMFPKNKSLINFSRNELGIEYEEFNLSNNRKILERGDDFIFDYSSQSFRDNNKELFLKINNEIDSEKEVESDNENENLSLELNILSELDKNYKLVVNQEELKTQMSNFDFEGSDIEESDTELIKNLDKSDFDTTNPSLIDGAIISQTNLLDEVLEAYIDEEIDLSDFINGNLLEIESEIKHKYISNNNTNHNEIIEEDETETIDKLLEEDINDAEIIDLDELEYNVLSTEENLSAEDELDNLSDLFNIDKDFDDFKEVENFENINNIHENDLIDNALKNELTEFENSTNSNNSDNDDLEDLLKDINTIDIEPYISEGEIQNRIEIDKSTEEMNEIDLIINNELKDYEVSNDNLNEDESSVNEKIDSHTLDNLDNLINSEQSPKIEQSEKKKTIDILSELNQKLTSAEYTWEEVERLLNENAKKISDNNVSQQNSIVENGTDEIISLDNGEKNNKNKDDIYLPISETLAKIYLSQNEYKEAIKVYQKLKSLELDKSTIYEKEIKKIKKILKNLEKK